MESFTKFEEELRKAGITVNAEKTKYIIYRYMVMTRNRNANATLAPVTVGHYTFENVNMFKRTNIT